MDLYVRIYRPTHQHIKTWDFNCSFLLHYHGDKISEKRKKWRALLTVDLIFFDVDVGPVFATSAERTSVSIGVTAMDLLWVAFGCLEFACFS